jgi:hypothetical protein
MEPSGGLNSFGAGESFSPDTVIVCNESRWLSSEFRSRVVLSETFSLFSRDSETFALALSIRAGSLNPCFDLLGLFYVV